MTEPVWRQASSPDAKGNFGLRRAEEITLPAYLAFIFSAKRLVSLMVADFDVDDLFAAELASWTRLCNAELPILELRGLQKMWDQPIIEKGFSSLLEASSMSEKARLLAVPSKESSAWLNASPAACLGNLLDDDSLRISVSLRLGAPICEPHVCKCSAAVDTYGRHGLSCRYAGRNSRHSSLNETLRRALVSRQAPAVLEPAGLLRDDTLMRPDGTTLIPWKEGKASAQDVTCVDTLYQSHVQGYANEAGYAANKAEDMKREKYRALESRYFFYPVGFETFGTFGSAAANLLRDIGKRIAERMGEKRASEFLR